MIVCIYKLKGFETQINHLNSSFPLEITEYLSLTAKLLTKRKCINLVMGFMFGLCYSFPWEFK